MPVKPALSGRDYTILHFNELGVFKGFGPWSDRSQAVPKQNKQAYLSLFAFTSPQCLHQTSVSPLLMLLFCSQDNLRLPWKARGALQTLAQPRFPQQRWPLPLVLYIQMGLPMAPLYPTHPTYCAPSGNASPTIKVSGGWGHWSFSSALSKCTVKPRTILVRPCYSSY